MTYPRTPEEKAQQLGARFACAAFNACGSLDAKACQEMGDALGVAIAELLKKAERTTRLVVLREMNENGDLSDFEYNEHLEWMGAADGGYG